MKNLLEKEACKTAYGLFSTLGEKFKLHQKETIVSLQYCKLKRKSLESSQEWMCRLQIKATNYKYEGYDRKLKEQFINGLKNETIIGKILMEATALKDTSQVSNTQVLMWPQRAKYKEHGRQCWKIVRDAKDFDLIRRDRQKQGHSMQLRDNIREKELVEN